MCFLDPYSDRRITLLCNKKQRSEAEGDTVGTNLAMIASPAPLTPTVKTAHIQKLTVSQ